MRRITKISIWLIVVVSTLFLVIFLSLTFLKKGSNHQEPTHEKLKIPLREHELGVDGKINNGKNPKKLTKDTSPPFPENDNPDVLHFSSKEKTKTEADLKKSAKHISESTNDDDQKNKVAGIFEVFPKLNEYDFYKYIHISNYKPFFTDQFISEVVKKVITEMNITQGKIEWGFKRENRSTLDIKFNWIAPENVYSKTYEFKLS